MYQSIIIDKAAEHLINIIDSNRCAVCDKSDGIRMRYPCGHTSCEECVPATESCPFCLTPQESSIFTTPSLDEPHSQRSQNARILMNAFETEFNVDVYKRHRISEQLKVEKELFPQCIQAPAKYYNKRKNIKTPIENTIIVYPGEEVTSHNKMENSNANVREWLTKCPKRKPLGDLNLNVIQKRPQKVLNNQNIDRSHRKRHYTEIWADENESYNDNTPTKTQNKSVKKFDNIITVSKTNSRKSNEDDSGVAVDDDVMVIDDSQSDQVDKDMKAWLSVLETEKYAQCGSTTLGSNVSGSSLANKITQPVKVPFYIKSPLSQNCEQCNEYYKSVNDPEPDDQPNVSITVDTKSFTAVINISKAQNTNKLNTKQSIEVQTDYKPEDLENKNQDFIDKKRFNEDRSILPTPSSINEDIFPGEANNINSGNKLNKSSNVVIAESDSDDDIVHSTSSQVIADVHRSYDEIVVLGDVEDLGDHVKRPRRAARGHTPTSTDSSDKENYNPNRKKRSANSKKKPMKK